MPVEAPPFVSFEALTTRHSALLSAQVDEALDTDAARQFLIDAAAAGAQIDSISQRDSLRSMINYWSATLSRTGAGEADRAQPPRVSLAPFDKTLSPELDEATNPFVGLAAFDVDQSVMFFGREKVVADLKSEMIVSRLLVLTGASGTGKSSLVRAGLIPAVAADPETASFVVALTTPGRDPLFSLVTAIAQALGQEPAWTETARPHVEKDPASVGTLVAGLIGERQFLLVIDQFEELISLSARQDRDAATKALSALITFDWAHVVITIRDEYLESERANRVLTGLAIADAVTFRIPPLDAAEIRQAILGPATRAGLVFQEGLVDRIVADTGTDPAALPLLQFCLLQLWKHRQGNRVTVQAYAQVGSPGAALGNAAQRIYDGFKTPQERQNAELIFKQLVRPSLSYEFVRDRVTRRELQRLLPPDSIKTVIQPFADAALICVTPGADRDEDRIEIVHEALIRNWDVLRRWALEAREGERAFLSLDGVAEQWEQSGMSSGHLLLGKALQQAEDTRDAYRQRARVDPIADMRVDRFIKAGRAAQRNIWAIISFVGTLLAILAAIAVLYYFARQTNFLQKQTTIALERTTSDLSERTAKLETEVNATVSDEDSARQFIQMLLSRDTIRRDQLPADYADMTPNAALVSPTQFTGPFDPNFLSIRADISPRLRMSGIVPLTLPNLRVYFDPASGLPLLAISQSDRAADTLRANVPNVLLRLPNIEGQADEAALARQGYALGHLVNWREVAWGSQARRAAQAANLLPTMVPLRLQGDEHARLAGWSALGAWLRTNHNTAATRVIYFSGAIPASPSAAAGSRSRSPRNLWKIAVSLNKEGKLVADAAMLPSRIAGEELPGRTSIEVIQKASGINFSGLLAALDAPLSGRPQPGSIAQPAAVAAAAAAAPAARIFVQIHDIDEERAEQVRQALAAQGFQTPGIEHVPGCVARAQMRYYYTEDADAAARAAGVAGAAILAAKLGDGSVAIHRLDPVRYKSAVRGNIELWLCGTPPTKGRLRLLNKDAFLSKGK